ncbi:MAG: extracellular solute-binding protein [Brachybacterium sp.]|uniref:extracellular solute-binding protein n=1 Tax=Brachybacterium sp. Z12 TaxID=2759167 RepID=UPI0018627CFD|nr:extracellular solute-binding protein [Brachybacterium sp. Z12]QNN82603.1 extracellular solute-binding protein [Brachybacterium sp. Z12]
MMQPTRRATLAGLGLTIPALAGLSACGGGTQPSGGGGSPSSLSVWALTGAKEDTYQGSFDAWNEANPDNEFAVEFFANDSYKEKIRTAIGSGNAPTLVFNWAGGTLADYVANESVVDLTGKVDDVLSRSIDSIATIGEVDGKQYGVPNNDTQPVVLYYSTALFEEHSVTPPTTWDELMTAVETFSAAGITPISLAGQSVWPELMYIQYLTDRIGGEGVFQKVIDGEPDAWSDPAITSALEAIIELVDAGAFGNAFGSVAADAGADAALVHTGQAAMLLQGSWVYGTFKQDAPEFVADGGLDFLNFPAKDGGTGDPANVVGNPANYWSVSADADPEVQELAIQYLNDFNLNDDMVDSFLAMGAIPAVEGLEEKFAGLEDEAFLSFAYDMVLSAPHFQLSWDQALAPAPAQELLNNLSRIFLGEIQPEEFVSNMNATLDA